MTAIASPRRPGIAHDVRMGLVLSRPKRLPPRLFYDEEGMRLFERITALPEYYAARTERALLERHAEDIVAAAAAGTAQRIHVVELGAGTAMKSQILLHALTKRQGRTLFLPVDVSPAALKKAQLRLAVEEPTVDVRPLALRHEEALEQVRGVGPRRLVLFLGSSIGNFDDEDAIDLLRELRGSIAKGGALLLGTDRIKDLGVLLPAYDDAQGVTAAFNKNLLARINRELGGHFDLEAFAHRVRWNGVTPAVEMHIESLANQRVRIDALGATVSFARGETIHTGSSIKYDEAHVERLLSRSGWARERTFTDERKWFGLSLCRAV
jgi:L-histidine Nalpha-methyltransferase